MGTVVVKSHKLEWGDARYFALCPLFKPLPIWYNIW